VGTDASIRVRNDDQTAAEVRSGVLCGREGCDEVFTAFKTLKSDLDLMVNKSCGVHIHVSFLG
jgi:hypothetical protein